MESSGLSNYFKCPGDKLLVGLSVAFVFAACTIATRALVPEIGPVAMCIMSVFPAYLLIVAIAGIIKARCQKNTNSAKES